MGGGGAKSRQFLGAGPSMIQVLFKDAKGSKNGLSYRFADRSFETYWSRSSRSKGFIRTVSAFASVANLLG